MNNVQRLFTSSAQPDLTTLEAVLDELSRFGQPRLSLLDSGWYCNVEMFIQGQGIQFKVASEFGHKKPMASVRECHDRMKDALRDIADKVKNK